MKPAARLLFNPLVILVFRLTLGLLFIFSALGKLMDPVKFLGAVSDYKLLPQILLPFFSAGLPGIELLAGASLLFGLKPKAGALAVAAMLLAFIVALSTAVLRGLELDCSCFDIIAGWSITLGQWPWMQAHLPSVAGLLMKLSSKVSTQVSWWTVLRDIYFLVPAVLIALAPQKEKRPA